MTSLVLTAFVAFGVVLGVSASVALAGDKEKKRAATPWSTFAAEGGSYAWAEPTGWIADEAASTGGLRMVWNEPGNAGGSFTIAVYAKTGTSLEALVKAASFGGKARAQKAWMCAEGEHGETKVAVVARTLESGDFLLLVLSAKPLTFKKLGGLPGVRRAGTAVMGFKVRSEESMPGE